MGAALGRLFAGVGHAMAFSYSRDPKKLAALARRAAFEPVDCGALGNARYLEPFALLIAELAYEQGRRPELGVRFLRPAGRRAANRG
jgi:predicted dinucleotide-binding enzyme